MQCRQHICVPRIDHVHRARETNDYQQLHKFKKFFLMLSNYIRITSFIKFLLNSSPSLNRFKLNTCFIYLNYILLVFKCLVFIVKVLL
jgi:hypothetical protein